MEKFRAKGELVGDINLKVRRAVNGTSGGKKQVLMPGEINDRSEVECRVAAPAGCHRGAMTNFRAEQNIFRNLPLHHHAAKTPILIARARIDAVAAATVNGPVAKTFLQPQRQERLHVTAAQPVRFAASGNFQQGKNSHLRQMFRLPNETKFHAEFGVAVTIM